MPLCQQQKRKLRLYISNTFNPARPDADDSDGSIASWELRVEGKLLDDVSFICLYLKHGLFQSLFERDIKISFLLQGLISSHLWQINSEWGK